MALILHIDTATEYAGIAISENNTLLQKKESSEQKNHAAFVQPAIAALIKELNFSLQNIDAICVTGGPGSYTGLRVGLASAKGICYALDKPLIMLNTLQVIANSVITEATNKAALICPMIDARRMEVFAAVYNNNLEEVEYTKPQVLSEDSYAQMLMQNPILFCGSGSLKWKPICKNNNAFFTSKQHVVDDMISLSLKAFQQQQFENLAYSEPFYTKEFHSTAIFKNKNL